MVYKAKKVTDWRKHLTDEELKFVSNYYAKRKAFMAEFETMTPEFIRIRNRAMKRAEYKHRSKT